jgi:hypothetical protein
VLTSGGPLAQPLAQSVRAATSHHLINRPSRIPHLLAHSLRGLPPALGPGETDEPPPVEELTGKRGQHLG